MQLVKGVSLNFQQKLYLSLRRNVVPEAPYNETRLADK